MMYEVIQAIDEYCREHNIQHRFVGSVSYTGFIQPNTTYSVNIAKKQVTLHNHKSLSAIRHDGSIRDIDIIVIEPSKAKVNNLKTFVKDFQKKHKNAKDFPFISIEAAIYPSSGKMASVFQFVTCIVVDKDAQWGEGNPYLVLDTVKQKISWDSLEAWKLKLDNGLEYTVRHPFADFLAYHFRSPSGLKPKDVAKVKDLVPLVETVLLEGKQQGIDYAGPDYYEPWEDYIKKLATAQGRVEVKAKIMKWYWSSIGNDLAHGKGPLGKFLINFSNAFTGVNQ